MAILCDTSNQNATGAIYGATESLDGLIFDGIDDYVALNLSIALAATIKTICFRIKLASTTEMILDGDNTGSLIIDTAAGTLQYPAYDNAFINGIDTDTVVADQWMNIVITSSTAVDNNTPTLGRTTAAAFTFGKFEIADLQYWSTEFTEQQAKSYHNSFAKRPVMVEQLTYTPVGDNMPIQTEIQSGTFQIAEDIESKYLECLTQGDILWKGRDLSQADVYRMSADGSVIGTCSEDGFTATMLAGSKLRSVICCEASTVKPLTERWYGIEFDVTAGDPDVTRIAENDDLTIHASLPIHERMYGCLLNDDGTVNYYLSPANWSLKADGTASNLDGTDGQVMVEIPEHWERFETDGNIRRVKVSLYSKNGFEHVPVMYVSAYKAALNRTNNKLASVVNLTADYRGGNNNAAWDAGDNTLLGKPCTAISRTNFRTYARNRGSSSWNQMSYQATKTLVWLIVIEYATRNSQKAVNGSLTAEGYRQGGLGHGVTTVDSTAWNTFSSYYPLIPCGTSNSLANGSGEVDYTIPNFGHASGEVKVNRYRGIENPFGDIWEWVDGINFDHQNGVGSFAYIIDTPANYADNTAANARTTINASLTSGYIELIHMGNYGDIISTAAGGVGTGSNTYFCDFYYSGYAGGNWGWRALIAGGYANYGAKAGLVCGNSASAASYATATIGSRLCFLGA